MRYTIFSRNTQPGQVRIPIVCGPTILDPDFVPTRNTQLLQQVLQFIKDNPEQHHQAHWFSTCGTAACFAGHAVLMSGWEHCEDQSPEMIHSHRHKGQPLLVRKAAAHELGLTLLESVALFDPENTIEMLELMVKDLVNGDVLMGPDDYRNGTQ